MIFTKNNKKMYGKFSVIGGKINKSVLYIRMLPTLQHEIASLFRVLLFIFDICLTFYVLPSMKNRKVLFIYLDKQGIATVERNTATKTI